MATMQDVADATGFSKSTVSRALRQDPTLMITEETRQRIGEAAEKLGYKIRRDKLLSASHKIVIIHKDTHFLNQIDNAYYFSIRFGIEEACQKNNIDYTFVPYSMLRKLPQDITGAIVAGNFEPEQMKYIHQALKDIKTVFTGKLNYYPDEYDWVTYDVGTCVELAMDALYEAGCRTVLFLGGADVLGTGKEYRKQYYYERYISMHPDMESIGIVESEHGAESGYHMMSKWLDENKTLPSAIFVSNDPIAIGAIRALLERGIDIPSEVSMIAVNGDSSGEMTSPPLATIDVHTIDMGRESVMLVMDRIMTERSLSKRVMFQPTLLNRGSILEK